MFLHFQKFFLGELQVRLFEIKIAFLDDGHQVDMGVRDFKANHSHGDTGAGDGFLDTFGHLFSENHHLSEFFVLDIEDIIVLMLGYHEGMSLGERIDVEKSEETVVFSDFITRDLPLDDS